MNDYEKKLFKIGGGLLGISLFSVLAWNSIHIIETGNVGVKSSVGQIDKTELKPGLNFAIPVIQKIEPVFTKTVMINYSGMTEKNDTEELYSERTLMGEDESGLELGIDLLVEVNPVMSQMADMYIDVGRQGFDKKVLQPIRGVSRKVLGQFKAELIMSQRKEVEAMLGKELERQFQENPYFELVNVQLKKIYLPSKVKSAIERVALAKQDAKAKQEQIIANENLAKSKVALAKGEAQAIEANANGVAKAMIAKANAKAKVIKLESEALAKANNLIAKSLTPALIQQNTVDAWKIGGAKVPNFVGGGGSQFIFDLNNLDKLK